MITRVQATDATKGFVVGADAACSMGVRTTTDGGATWPGTGSLADTLARDAKDPTKVRAPGGRTVAPCGTVPVVDLARNSERGAQVLCADGSLRTSTDDGATWPETGKVTSGLALDGKLVGSTVTAYVAWSRPGCEGVQVSTVADGKVGDLGCVTTRRLGAGQGGHRGVRHPDRLDGRRRVHLALDRRAQDLVQGLTRTAGLRSRLEQCVA